MKTAVFLPVFAGLGAYFCFTMMDSILKIVLSNASNSLSLTLLLLNASALMYYCIFFQLTNWKPAKTKNYKFHIFRGIVNIFGAAAIMYSFSNFSLNYVYTVIFIAPFFNTFFGIVLLKDKVSRTSWASIAIGFIGVLTALNPWGEHLTVKHAIAFFGAVMLTTSFLMLRCFGQNEKPITTAFYGTVILSVFYGGMSVFFFAPMPLEDAAKVVAAGLLMAIAGLSITYGFLKIGFAAMGNIHYTQLLWGTLASYVFFKETPSEHFYIGAGLIILGGLLNSANFLFRFKWL